MPIDLTLTTRDQYALSALLYEPQTSNQCSVLLSSAMGVKQTYYANYATYLAEQGFVVLTYDYRGIGRSKSAALRGFKATMLNWASDDQTAAITYLTQHYPSSKLLVVGHSLGGQIIGLTPEYERVAALMGIAAQSGYWQGWEGLLRVRMVALWFILIPLLARLYGYFPSRWVGMGSNDIPAQVVLEWASAGRRPRYFRDLYGSPYNHYASVTAPMRLYSFADDDFAPKRAVENLRTLYPNAPSEHRHIQPIDIGVPSIGHFGFFRPQCRETLWAESAAWLRGQ
jgi:predicted alpha/beta hydrolase